MAEQAAGFVWYDLMTTDVEAAARFYGAVLGWESRDAGMGDSPYRLWFDRGSLVGGLIAVPPNAHASPPAWLGHIGVEDVDRMAARVKAAGGAVLRAPEDIPEVGRFAVAADPHGAVFLMFHPLTAEQTGGSHATVVWHELYARDREEAWAFYSGLFGWTRAEAIEMGQAGVYQTFAAGGAPIGGMMTQAPGMPGSPGWLYYFIVDGVDAVVERVRAEGGQVVMGPLEVPGGGWMVQAVDPQGARFAVSGAKR